MMLPQNCNLTSDRTALSEKDGFHSEVAHLSSAFHFIFLNQSRPLGSTCIAVKDNLSEALSTDNFQGIIWIPVDFLPQLRTSMLHSHLHLRKVIQSHWSGCALSSLNWHKKRVKNRNLKTSHVTLTPIVNIPNKKHTFPLSHCLSSNSIWQLFSKHAHL